MPITGLIFDMDGTIGDTIPSILLALRETFARFSGRVYSDEEIQEMFGPSEEGIVSRRVPADQYEAAFRYFLDRYAGLHADRPYPGILDLMRHLQGRGVRMAVVTGKGPGTAAISMRAYRLDAYIDCLETGSTMGGIKPALIRRVLERWGLPAEQVAYLGDTRSDMADARAVGVLPLGAAWCSSATVTEADTPHRFNSVAALKDWLEAMGG